MKTKTKTVFRTFKDDGSVIALFPQIPSSNCGWYCESYMHIGQHSGACPRIVQSTRPSTPEEIAPLKRELESIGYNVITAKRITYADYLIRKAAL